MSNNIKFLLLNITLLAGMYCNCEYSRCAGCCKNCCGNGEEGNNNKNENIYKKNKESKDATTTNNIIGQNNFSNQQVDLSDNNTNGKNNNKENSVKNEKEGNSDGNNNNKKIEDNKIENKEINDEINEDEAKNQQVFKIEEGAIDNNNLGCFGNKWFEEYQKKKNDNNKDTILLYKLTEQKNKEKTAGTLVYSKGSKKLEYTNGGNFPKRLKKFKEKWAIFKVTTLKNEKQKGNSHIFFCSDVSSIGNNGLFEEIDCWSIEILAANTQRVEDFCNMFKETKSYLEQDTKKPGASGFIGLEELDLSGANNLAAMFRMALFKQKTINSLSELRLQDNANIRQMFYVDKNNFVDENGPDFSVLNRWIKGNGVQFGYRYDIFFQGDYNAQDNDKLPEWCDDKKKKES